MDLWGYIDSYYKYFEKIYCVFFMMFFITIRYKVFTVDQPNIMMQKTNLSLMLLQTRKWWNHWWLFEIIFGLLVGYWRGLMAVPTCDATQQYSLISRVTRNSSQKKQRKLSFLQTLPRLPFLYFALCWRETAKAHNAAVSCVMSPSPHDSEVGNKHGTKPSSSELFLYVKLQVECSKL